MTEAPDPLRRNGSSHLLALAAIFLAVAACGGSWLAFALIVNLVATTVSKAGLHAV